MIVSAGGGRVITAPTALALAAALQPQVVVETAVSVTAEVIRGERSIRLTKADVAFLASLIFALDADAPPLFRMLVALALCMAYCSHEL